MAWTPGLKGADKGLLFQVNARLEPINRQYNRDLRAHRQGIRWLRIGAALVLSWGENTMPAWGCAAEDAASDWEKATECTVKRGGGGDPRTDSYRVGCMLGN